MNQSFIIAIVLGTILFHSANGQLAECWKCVGSEDCGDRDFCLGTHDRCLKLKYEHDGSMVNDAKCSKRTECDTEIGKTILCDKKKKCEITACCKDDLCNSPAVTTRFSLSLLGVVFVVSMYVLFGR